MISDKSLFWIGYNYGQFSTASVENHRFFGSIPSDIAIHIGKRPLSTSETRVEIGVVFRPNGQVASWWHLDTVPTSEVDAYILDCRNLINTFTRSETPIVEELLP